MKRRFSITCKIVLSSLVVFFFASLAAADDLEGSIETLDRSSRSFVVQGIRFFVTPETDYDDGLKSFDDLKEGQKVEVDFEYRDRKHLATEVELEE